MATLSIPRTYAAGTALEKSDIDGIVDAIETFVNTTQLDYENIDWTSVINSLTSTQANYVTSDAGWGDLTTATLSSVWTLTSTSVTLFSVTPPSAGTYMLVATVVPQVAQTAVFSGGVGAYVIGSGFYSLSLEIQNSSTSAVISSITPDVDALLGSAIRFSSRAPVSKISTITLTSTAPLNLVGSITGSGTAAGAVLSGSMQLFRLRQT